MSRWTGDRRIGIHMVRVLRLADADAGEDMSTMVSLIELMGVAI